MKHLLLLLVSVAAAAPSKTFRATSHDNLDPLPLPTDLVVDSLHAVLNKTTIYQSHYHPSMVRNEEQYGTDPYPTTEAVQDIMLIRGADVDASTIHASPWGLVSAATTAYAYHANLRIRPDDVWITILAQFSFYFQARSEFFRDQIVDFEGKKELVVKVFGYTIANAPYDWMTREFLNLIGDEIQDPTLKNWFLPGFTTTTEVDEVVTAATVMCTFQDYFTYVFYLGCGIPEVTLEGSVGDWQKLRRKINRILNDFDDGSGLIPEWHGYLAMILDNFVESAQHGSDNNLDFWDNILYYNTAGYGTPLLSGWITAFSFFNKHGQKTPSVSTPQGFNDVTEAFETTRTDFPTIDMVDLNQNVLSCPATVATDFASYNATLFVGQMSFDYVAAADDLPDAMNPSTAIQDVREVQPRNDWALVIETGETTDMRRPLAEEVQDETFPGLDLGANMCYWYEQMEFTSNEPAPGPPDFCFSSGTRVQVKRQEEVEWICMSQLQLGDYVRVASPDETADEFSQVYSFGHWDPTVETSYLQIHASGLQPLELTDSHLVFVAKNQHHVARKKMAVPASNVQVGDLLATDGPVAYQVTSIQRVSKQGAYAPFTHAGTLVVNGGVIASSYVSMTSCSATLRIFGGSIDTGISMQTIAHMATAPRRWWCRFFATCGETYTADGIATWVDPMRQLALWYLQHEVILWTAATTVLMGVLGYCTTMQGKAGRAIMISFGV